MTRFFIPKILSSSVFVSAELLASKLDFVSAGLSRLNIDKKQPLGLAADISVDGLSLLLSAISMGLKVAICPLREPGPILDAWLSELKIDYLLTSVDLAVKTKKIRVSDFYVGEKSHQAKSLARSFLSIIRTSGSTAAPKSAMISGSAHLSSALSCVNYFALDEHASLALSLPLSHVSGLSILFRAMLSGCTLVLTPTYQDLITAINKNHISHLSLVPAQLARLLDDSVDLSKLKAVILGGDYLPQALAKEALSRGVALFSTYGLSETASMVHVIDMLKNVGTTLPHAQINFGPDQEILVSGPALFSGYFPKTITSPIFATGDLGFLDQKGCLQVLGRKDNRIICGGENILPEEIEHFLHQHPLIIQSIVIGVKDRIWGQSLQAFIRSKNCPINELELRDFLQDKLAPFKIPKVFMPWPKDAPLEQKKARPWLQNSQNQAPLIKSLTALS